MAALELKQQLKLSQQLIMTPQLQQAIKLLQLSRLELLETIHQELETNPVLEESQEESGEAEEPGAAEAAAEVAAEVAAEPYQEVEILEKVREDFDWEGYLDEYNTGTPVLVETDPNKEWQSYDQRLTVPTSLQDHLVWQIRLSDMSDEEREVAGLIIGNLNRDGYLDASLDEIAAMGKVSTDMVERVLAVVQLLDPVGVAARDPRECLLIQARSLELEDDLVVRIVEHYLHFLENRNYPALIRALKRPAPEVKAAVDVILSLDPRPGSRFAEESTEYISPDIYVMKVDGEFVVLLNEDGMPKLKVSSYYRHALTEDAELPSEAKEYIQGKLRSAAWLIKSIHQRQRTLFKVAHSIVKLQADFFEKGVSHLRPMVLRDVAEDVGMHESTISRVTASKYMHTPHGIFELKYFFNSSINSVLGEAVASESVKERIRQIIREEDLARPFSDQEIVEKLEGENISIARRTVAKYREMLGVLPSNKRKRTSWGE
ncbi:RNA polymerase factor sigma-54 [Syntrophobacter fumaroxidans]|uniref:RNA polymerase, sigma 54 subunit, RpoN n=1 Tax=Syntrophobacter fumaroxidans (strain DSM 10017 / MPOB) TaxID=335543 RepID=A0LK00_SYNFM|nr:RNA polymerase factor sigma-54 [Syntrophobacter fumaroxidans]ABK17752.1 RNA polymerase, sigma 54 subunit, RpoN [Syntrophobacter fumaroxidans MPOB]